MSGYKQTIFSDAPISFWSFDFDSINATGGFIIDEINNQNPMIIQSDINGDNFTFTESLNLLETSGQSSISIAADGKHPTFGYMNQYFEVIHTSTYDFPIRGEYSVEFLLNKAPPIEIRQLGEPGNNLDVETPLILKIGTIGIKIVDYNQPPVGFSDHISFVFYPLNSFNQLPVIRYNDGVHGPLYNTTLHCIASMSVTQVDVTEYEATYRVFVNGRLIEELKHTFFGVPPISSANTPWLIAGNGGTTSRLDWATELLILDQIQVYNYGIDIETAAIHYRKTKTYQDQIKFDFPIHYWSLNDLIVPGNTTISSELTTSVDGKIIGPASKGAQGNLDIITSKSVAFQANTALYFEETNSNNTYQPLIDISSDYTLEFWYKSGNFLRGLLFDSGQEDPDGNWTGLRVYLNARNNQESAGSIQFSETYSNFVQTRELDALNIAYNFADGNWHHVAIRRNGFNLSLIVDGLVHETSSFAIGTSIQPSQMTFMNGRPGAFQVTGNLMQIAYYQYALQDHQIYNRWRFNNRYRVSGVTLLQGVPIKAQLRFYDSASGELVHQTDSDPLTGQYEFHPLNNRYLDVVSRLPDVTTARHRIHGPIVPGEFNDVHI